MVRDMSLSVRLLALLAATAVAIPSLSALTLDLTEAQGFNLLTWGNATLLNSDTEGRVAVGGNASFNSYSVGTHAVNPTPQTGSLIVKGNLTAGNGQVYNGSIYVGGTYSGPSSYNLNSAPGSVTQSGMGAAVPFNFGAAQAALTSKSSLYGTQAETGTSILQWSTMTLTGTNTGLNVFTVSAAELAATSTLSINVAAGSQVLINVTGSSVSMGNMGINGNFDSSNVLFNFYQAGALALTGIGVEGSILAPLANVSFYSGQMNGQLIANSFAGATWGVGELHQRPFNNRTNNVPDNWSTGWALVGALAAVAVAARRNLYG